MNWKDFYSKQEQAEIVKGFSGKGIKPSNQMIVINEGKNSDGESDSEPSEDNFEPNEINEFFKEVLKKVEVITSI